MRIYTESNEETLRARKLLTQWTGDGSLSKEQYQRLEQDTVSDLRITNIFLRQQLERRLGLRLLSPYGSCLQLAARIAARIAKRGCVPLRPIQDEAGSHR
ncbi:hypothetical protein [Edaphobacter aggregans]|uniref:hypothetical protein n=1 Tax=Edaphobacter aggregans TaxID=570835 RepID=UPI0005578588|nr:hypothetical protein [Edaphobacter aggregans]